MSDDHEGDAGETIPDAGKSVLQILQSKTGEAPHITLRDEDSAAVSAPLINPNSGEKTAVPTGKANYQFLGEIARGGMGVILKGHDTDLGRDVAVKVLARELADREEVVQRFVEEAQIGGQLQHPGIVPVYELGLMADERPYFTMKLVKGRTMATLLTERASPKADRRRLLDIFESVCQTVAYAHSRGVIHRDLKPANIMVGAFGEVQVVDWGLAKVLSRGGTADEKRAREMHSNLTILETVRSDGSGSGSASMVGSILGTPAYMPPEQASGLVDRLDERADVFALGAILCEILTGKPPYVGEREEIIAAAAQAEYEGALTRLDESGADEDLIKLTKQCLLAAPAARPANASIVAERVHEQAVSVEERAQAAQVEAAEARVRADAERKKRRLSAALGLAVAAIVVVAAGGWTYLQNERAAQERAEAQREAEIAQAKRQREAEESKRLAELSTQVLADLGDATRLQGSGSWNDAIRTAAEARAKAEAGGANDELLARVDRVLSDIEEGRDAMVAQRERDRDTARLLAELLEVREPDWDAAQLGRYQIAKREFEQIETVFLAHGIDLFAGNDEEAAQLLLDRGLGAEIALVLDAWAAHARDLSDDASATRVLRIGNMLDPDPLRADLRAALERKEDDVLLWIAENGLELQPPGTFELLGFALERLDREDDSLEVYRNGVLLHPGDFALQYRLASALLPPGPETGTPAQLEEGAACMLAALALRPESAISRFYLGRFYHKMRRYQDAAEQFEILLERSPDELVVKFQLGWSLAPSGDAARAKTILEPLIELRDPPWIANYSLVGLGLAERRLGDLESAAEHLGEGAARLARNGNVVPEWHDALFDIYARLLGSDRDAILYIEERWPDESNIHNNVAWELLANQRRFDLIDDIIRLAQRAVEIDEQGTYWNTLGVAFYYAGRYEAAIGALLESLKSDQGTTLDVIFIALSHQRLGNDEARSWYDRAVRELADVPRGSDPDSERFIQEAHGLFR